jgi:hypothetical protein
MRAALSVLGIGFALKSFDVMARRSWSAMMVSCC